MNRPQGSLEKMKLLITIQDYTDESDFLNHYLNIHLPFHVSTHGFGTAPTDILDYLGLGTNKKSIVFSTIAESQVERTFEYLRNTLQFHKAGRGVAITLPVTSLSYVLTHLDSNQFQEKVENEVNSVEQTGNYELIIAILTQGYADDAMTAAKQKGANGGTLIHANGLGSAQANKFLGITVQPEKDLVLIIIDKKQKKVVMDAINEAVGLHTEGRGVMFSIPVSDTIGLNSVFREL